MYQAFPVAGLLVSLIFAVLYSYMIQRKKTDCERRTAVSSTVLCTSFASLAVFSCPITLLYYGPRCHWILSSRESPLTVCLDPLSLLYACYCAIIMSLACYRVF
ncbi:hypothetical protein BDR06DRAFT_948417 [Suillus hirtellus]|nr:hypothetical protein BDR06DRAFT_948417 [Suillus hirtellus]